MIFTPFFLIYLFLFQVHVYSFLLFSLINFKLHANIFLSLNTDVIFDTNIFQANGSNKAELHRGWLKTCFYLHTSSVFLAEVPAARRVYVKRSSHSMLVYDCIYIPGRKLRFLFIRMPNFVYELAPKTRILCSIGTRQHGQVAFPFFP